MLLSLITLSDSEIELVTSAVNEWCRTHQCDINSNDGYRALTAAIELVQRQHSLDRIIPELTAQLKPTISASTGQAR